jgi:hypothetical protein
VRRPDPGGDAAAARCVLRRKSLCRSLVGTGMYPLVYWAGVTTLLVWTAYSAYSAITGF